MITPAPEIQTLTTYYLAPWQDLTAATAPSDVIRKICQTFANGTEECITEYQIWRTSLVTATATTTATLNISTTIHGPSGVIIWETFVANVTEQITTFSMLTTMEVEYQTQFTTTQMASAAVSTAPTVYETMTVELASSTPEPTISSQTSRLFQHTTNLILLVLALALLIAEKPHVHAAAVQPAATDANSTSALRKYLHDLHNPNNNNRHHVVLPLLIAFLSLMGSSVLCALVILLLPYCVKGAMAGPSSLVDAVARVVTTTTTTAISSSSLGRAGDNGTAFNVTDTSGPTCYTPTCEYEPESGAARRFLMADLYPVYVAGVICFLCWALPRYWRAMTASVPQKKPGGATKTAREKQGIDAGDSLGGPCTNKLCSECREKAERNSVDMAQCEDNESADGDGMEDGW
ncbi:hypothetical protein B0A55_11609 [Friedmanniomyces simplex]|uniref:Uncharacterized protein n=1 Tax=Friedmanniomyces simplex TaxID=329884 RepID=A0A4U0WK17_9PEZI|nr:hypothetical protein B0A55_11609 [Friedmanniomyces simplex]